MWFSVNRVCPTKIAFFVACVVDDQGVLRLQTHRLRSLLQAPCLCRQGAWRWYNSPICGSMALLHGCRWFCRLSVLLQQLNNVGTKRDFVCGGLGYNVASRPSHVGLQWTSNGCSWQGQTLFPAWRHKLCISSGLAGYKLLVVPSTLVVCNASQQWATICDHQLPSCLGMALSRNVHLV
jgi:hypothetical protein